MEFEFTAPNSTYVCAPKQFYEAVSVGDPVWLTGNKSVFAFEIQLMYTLPK